MKSEGTGTEGNGEVEGGYRKRDMERKREKKRWGRPSDSVRWDEREMGEGVQPPNNCEWGFGFLILYARENAIASLLKSKNTARPMRITVNAWRLQQ